MQAHSAFLALAALTHSLEYSVLPDGHIRATASNVGVHQISQRTAESSGQAGGEISTGRTTLTSQEPRSRPTELDFWQLHLPTLATGSTQLLLSR